MRGRFRRGVRGVCGLGRGFLLGGVGCGRLERWLGRARGVGLRLGDGIVGRGFVFCGRACDSIV